MPEKELKWIGSSKRDLLAMPDEVVQVFGFALGEAQLGRKHPDAKPMNQGVLQGKGIFETPKPDIDLIEQRYQAALQDAKAARED